MLGTDLAARIEAEVPSLAGRVRQAAELAELARRKEWPQASPFGFVVPLGIAPTGAGEAGAGAFVQDVDELWGLVLFLRAAGDPTGGRATPALDALVWAAIGAVAGWGPEPEPGVFRLSRGQILSMEAGALLYQLDFAIGRQVRNL